MQNLNLKLSLMKNKSGYLQRGMTYIELMVVLSIFAILSGTAMYNYSVFQSKIDLKNLANQIVLKIVEAQKSALSGVLPPSAQYTLLAYGSDPTIWKPSYGVYFDLNDATDFIYFTDVNPIDNSYSGPNCSGECIEKINITGGDYISRIESISGSTATNITNPLSITFRRPDSSAVFKSGGVLLSGFDYIQLTLHSSNGADSFIQIYPSGRIQVK